MAIVACACDSLLNNSGVPDCRTIEGVAQTLIAVPLKANDGTTNRVLLNATLNQTFFDDLINETDGSKRWYPMPRIVNIEDVRADSIAESFNDGKNVIIQEGARSFNGMVVNRSTVFLSKIKSWGCRDFGFYTIDKQGNLIGKISADGLALEPIAVDVDTWDAGLVKTTDTTSQKVRVKFEWLQSEKDEDIRQISQGDLGGANLLTLNGLLDVNAVASAPAVTTFTLTQTLDYGSLVTPIEVEGWVIGDYTLLDTGGSPITITTVTETPANSGIYVFVYPTQPSGDVTLSAAKDGFDFPVTTVTIP